MSSQLNEYELHRVSAASYSWMIYVDLLLADHVLRKLGFLFR